MGASYRRSSPSTPMNGPHGRNRCIFDLSGHPDEGDTRTFKSFTAVETRRDGAYAARSASLEMQPLDAVLVDHSIAGKVLRHIGGGHERVCGPVEGHIGFRVGDHWGDRAISDWSRHLFSRCFPRGEETTMLNSVSSGIGTVLEHDSDSGVYRVSQDLFSSNAQPTAHNLRKGALGFDISIPPKFGAPTSSGAAPISQKYK
jgi:hypothetical protein